MAILSKFEYASDMQSSRANTLKAAALRALMLREQPSEESVSAEIVRYRSKGKEDQQIKVEYLFDKENPQAVLIRLTPLSAMLSTQQAADRLMVSRPYIIKLIENNTFQGVLRTGSGHRRIPLSEVERVQQSMREARRKALDEIESLTEELRAQELREAGLR